MVWSINMPLFDWIVRLVLKRLLLLVRRWRVFSVACGCRMFRVLLLGLWRLALILIINFLCTSLVLLV